MLGTVFDRFVEKSPISVMVRGALIMASATPATPVPVGNT